jgi:hypothetical protein
VPHLDAETRAELWATIPEFQREARAKGVPALGSGLVYPIAEEDFVIEGFAIPAHWGRAFALDVGWNRTAAVWGALDRNTNILYLYSEHYQGAQTPTLHAHAIRQRGAWIPGVIDPASAGSSQHDGQRIIDLYRKEGLDLAAADNDVEAGIYDVWQRLQMGTLKVFRTLINLRQEYRMYRREANGSGRIHKPKLPAALPDGKSAAQFGDHLMDCLRYLVRSGISRMKTEPLRRPLNEGAYRPPTGPTGWMG